MPKSKDKTPSRRDQIIDRKIEGIKGQIEYYKIEKEFKSKTERKTDHEDQRLEELRKDIEVLKGMKK